LEKERSQRKGEEATGPVSILSQHTRGERFLGEKFKESHKGGEDEWAKNGGDHAAAKAGNRPTIRPNCPGKKGYYPDLN